MNTGPTKRRLFFLSLAAVLLLGVSTPGLAQTMQAARDKYPNLQAVPNGSKLKFKGVVVGRDADTFTIRDRNRTDYQVLITDRTSIKTYGGFFKSGKKYPVTDILRGLIVEVEGRGDVQGQLVADKIRFNDSDMRA